MAAGLETTLDDSARWSAIGRRIDPDPRWVRAADARYEKFAELGNGT
jgi:xylulokinase